MQGDYSLGELAVRFGLGLRGEPDLRCRSVATLSHAGRGALSFLANPRYRRQMQSTHATAVLVAAEHVVDCPVAALIDPNPYLAYARIADLLHPQAPAAAGIHPSAVVAAGVRIAGVGQRGTARGHRGRCGDRRTGVRRPGLHRAAWCANRRRLAAHDAGQSVPRRDGSGSAASCTPESSIGADGFGFAPNAGTWVKVPQVGSVQIGDDVEIGANTTIDRGAIDDTVVEDGVKLDNQIQVGHNVTIGAHTRHCGLHRNFRQHQHRPALHDRRWGRHRRPSDDCR